MKNRTCILIIVLALFAILLCGAAENNGEQTETVSAEQTVIEKQTAAHDYTHLRATRYKNLLATKYPNLVKTMETPEEEIIATEQEEISSGNSGSGNSGSSGSGNVGGSSSGSQSNVGTATNPGYSGSVGKYSLSDKTVAAHLTVQGTDVVDKPIWQCETSTTYYEPSNVAWAAKTAHLRSGELSQNTVIYGHNWGNCFVPFKKTGPEFESLMAYSYEDFVEENQYIYLTTNGGVHTFQVFAVCFTKDLSFYINCNNIDVSDVAYTAMKMSLFDFGVSVSDSDKLITLSTCTRYYKGLGANQRFIIMGKLIS